MKTGDVCGFPFPHHECSQRDLGGEQHEQRDCGKKQNLLIAITRKNEARGEQHTDGDDARPEAMSHVQPNLCGRHLRQIEPPDAVLVDLSERYRIRAGNDVTVRQREIRYC